MESLRDKRRSFLPLYFFIAGVLLRCFLGSYLKTPTFYWDELKYYGLARSIYNGWGLTIRNTTTNFQKILYPLVISPLFGVKDVELRVRLIALVNSLLMNSCVFPLWVLCSRLGVDKRKRIYLAALLIIWPDMLMTETFMSENLYWPLFFWYILLHFYPPKDNFLFRAVAEGVLIYLGYLCKEVFASVLAASALCLLLETKLCPREKHVQRSEWLRLLFTGIVFLIMFLVGKLLFFSGLGSSYNQTDLSALANNRSPFYLFYAVFYLIVSTILSVLLLPAVVPILRFRRMKPEHQRFFIYISAFIVSVICGIAYAISIRENLGAMIPRIHIRYYAPAVFLLLPVFALCPGRDEGTSKDKDFVFLFIFAIVIVALFRSSGATDVDHTTLQWVAGFGTMLANKLTSESVFFWVFQVIEVVMALSASIGIYMYFSERKKDPVLPFFIFLLIPIIISSFVGHEIIKRDYTERLAPFDSVSALSNHFAQTDDNVLFLTDTFFEYRQSKAWDLRYEPVDRSYYFVYSGYYEDPQDFTSSLTNSAKHYAPDAKVSDYTFSGYIDCGHYSSTDRIDYVVIPREAKLEPENDLYFEYIPTLSSDFYSVYRNKNPELLNIVNFVSLKSSHEKTEESVILNF